MAKKMPDKGREKWGKIAGKLGGIFTAKLTNNGSRETATIA